MKLILAAVLAICVSGEIFVKGIIDDFDETGKVALIVEYKKSNHKKCGEFSNHKCCASNCASIDTDATQRDSKCVKKSETCCGFKVKFNGNQDKVKDTLTFLNSNEIKGCKNDKACLLKKKRTTWEEGNDYETECANRKIKPEDLADDEEEEEEEEEEVDPKIDFKFADVTDPEDYVTFDVKIDSCKEGFKCCGTIQQCKDDATENEKHCVDNKETCCGIKSTKKKGKFDKITWKDDEPDLCKEEEVCMAGELKNEDFKAATEKKKLAKKVVAQCRDKPKKTDGKKKATNGFSFEEEDAETDYVSFDIDDDTCDYYKKNYKCCGSIDECNVKPKDFCFKNSVTCCGMYTAKDRGKGKKLDGNKNPTKCDDDSVCMAGTKDDDDDFVMVSDIADIKNTERVYSKCMDEPAQTKKKKKKKKDNDLLIDYLIFSQFF